MDLWNTIQHSFVWSFVSTIARSLARDFMEWLSHLGEQLTAMF